MSTEVHPGEMRGQVINNEGVNGVDKSVDGLTLALEDHL
jgi:hypothetical protein